MATQKEMNIQNALKQLGNLGFSSSELDRIKSNNFLLDQLDKFISLGRSFLPTKSGASCDPKTKNISFQPNTKANPSPYTTYNILVHELGHSLGTSQAANVKTYNTAKAYAFARGIGEAEAIYNEYFTIQKEIVQNKLTVVQKNYPNYQKMTSGFDEKKGASQLNLYQYLTKNFAKASQKSIYDFLSKQNMYGMKPSGNSSGFTYYENDIAYFLEASGKSTFVADYIDTFGKNNSTPQALQNYINFIKSVADYDLLGDSGNNTIKATGAKNRLSLLFPKSTFATTLKGAAYMYGDGGDDTLEGTNKASVSDKILGGDGKDTLIGLAGDDILAGNAGNDTLEGGAGKDTMKGGKDFDTYIADALDTISDSDGKGEVFFGSNRLKLGQATKDKHNGNIYTSLDGKIKYNFDAKTKKLTVSEASSNNVNQGLVIENFSSGALGITLLNTATGTRSATSAAGNLVANAAAMTNNLINAMAAFGSDNAVASFSNNDPYAANMPQLAVAA